MIACGKSLKLCFKIRIGGSLFYFKNIVAPHIAGYTVICNVIPLIITLTGLFAVQRDPYLFVAGFAQHTAACGGVSANVKIAVNISQSRCRRSHKRTTERRYYYNYKR